MDIKIIKADNQETWVLCWSRPNQKRPAAYEDACEVFRDKESAMKRKSVIEEENEDGSDDSLKGVGLIKDPIESPDADDDGDRRSRR